MGSNPIFYNLLLLSLVSLCILFHVLWPYERPGPRPTPPTPTLLPRKRSKAPTPLPGLLQKPLCDACERAGETRPQAPGAPPPLITFPRGRKRTINTAKPCCPAHNCSYYGWTSRGNSRSNGHRGGQPWRQFHWVACDGYFQETHGTPLHGKHVALEQLVWAGGALAEGVGIRAVARVFAVAPTTVRHWLVEVAAHATAFSQYGVHDVPVTQVPLDALFALLRAVPAGAVSEAEAITRRARSPQWGWTALEPVTKRRRTIDVGDRTRAMAQRVVHQVVQVRAPGCVPLFLTDGCKEYATALLTHGGQWVQPPRRQDKGPVPQPRWMPRPELL